MTNLLASSSSAFPASARSVRIVVLAALVFSGGALALSVVVLLRDPPRIDQLSLQRLDIVEPDGTPRMIISSRARFPGSFIQRQEIARPDRNDTAGILFVNDEGTENGGLIQSGKLDSAGKAEAGLSLTFDRFRQDQVLQLLHQEGGDQAETGIMINDRPSHKEFSIEDTFRFVQELERMSPADRETAEKKHGEQGHFGHPRAFFGTANGAAKLSLADAQGRPRLNLSVSAKGEPSLELLDDKGQVVRTIDANKL